MNIIFYSLLIFGFSYLILKLIANVSSKKISKFTRLFIFLFSIILAFLFAFGGRFLLSLPLILLSLAVVKLKGLTIYQIFALYRLIQTLRMSGRFSFNQKSQSNNYSNWGQAFKPPGWKSPEQIYSPTHYQKKQNIRHAIKQKKKTG